MEVSIINIKRMLKRSKRRVKKEKRMKKMTIENTLRFLHFMLFTYTYYI